MVSLFKKKKSSEEIITKLYAELLNREPDQEGFSHYLHLLEKDMINEEQLRIQFKNSSEYKIIQLSSKYRQESKTKIKINDKMFFVNPSNNSSFWAQLQIGLWESYSFNIFDRFLDLDHSYIDIGSWIGPTALYGCQKAKYCYALEPDPIAFRFLKNNLELNPDLVGRVSLFNQCMMNSTGMTSLSSKGDGGDSCSSTIHKQFSTSWKVPSITLQQFILDNSIHDFNFIKIDIEGGEFSVLPNMLDLLKEKKPTLYLSLHLPLMDDPKNSIKKIYDVIKMYDIFYDNQLNEIDLDFILNDNNYNKFFEIIVSEK